MAKEREPQKLSRAELIGIIAGLILVGSLFIEWFSLETENVEPRRGRRLGLRRRRQQLHRLRHLPDPALAADRGRRRAADPQLHRRPRPPPVLAARRADRDRRAHRLRPDRLQRDHRQALAERHRRQPLLRLLHRAPRLARDLPIRRLQSRRQRRRRAAKTARHVLASPASLPRWLNRRLGDLPGPALGHEARPQPRARARPRDRGGRARRRPLDRAGGEGEGRRRRGRRDAPDARHGPDGRRRRDRRGREGRGARCSSTARRSATAARPSATSPSTRSRARP